MTIDGVDGVPVRVRATDAALAGLRELLTDGSLGSGDRLPSEPELSGRLGVSRGSLREAVRTLVALGVLEVRHGDGTYVTPMRPGTMLSSFAWAVDLVPMEGVLELFEIRRVLEAHAAALAAARMSDDALDSLGGLLERMRATEDLDVLATMDVEFHQQVNDTCGNQTLAEIVRTFHLRGGRLDMYRLLPAGVARDVSWLGHQAIYEALRRRDAAGAAAAAAAHTQQTEAWIRQLRATGVL